MGGGLTPPPALLIEWAFNRERFPYGERRGPFLIILISVLLFLTLAVVAARLWARFRIRRNAGLDDWLIIAALPILLGYDACHVLGFFYYGVDRHAWELTIPQAVDVRIITWYIALGYLLVTTLVKVSILIFYRRLSEGSVTMSWIWTVRCFITFVVLHCVVFIVLLSVGCQPLEAFWKQMDREWTMTHSYTCFNEGAEIIASSIISGTTDAAVFVLPLLVLRRLQMPRKQKWALSALFGVGFFLCVCGVMRIVYIHASYYTTYDTPWAAIYPWSWTLVETHFAIICASAPSLKIFFRRYLQSTHGRDTGDTNNRGNRNEYNNFGSEELGGSAGPSYVKDDVNGGDGIYMADMLAYKAARAETERKSKGLPLLDSLMDEDASLKSPVVSVAVAEEGAEDGLAGVGGASSESGDDAHVAEEQFDEGVVRSSRGSTDSILETHVAVRMT